MQVGAELTHTKDVSLAFGCMYKLDKDTTVKGKVRSAARLIFCTSLQRVQKLRLTFLGVVLPLLPYLCRLILYLLDVFLTQVDADGMLYSSYKQKISPLATMTLAAQIDTVNLSENKHKFGMVLNVTA